MKYFNTWNNFELAIDQSDFTDLEKHIDEFKQELEQVRAIKDDLKLIQDTANLHNDNAYYLFEDNKHYNVITKTKSESTNGIMYVIQMKDSQRFFKIEVNIRIQPLMQKNM